MPLMSAAEPLWSQALARYPFAAKLLPGWREQAGELPAAYQAALDAALIAFDPESPLEMRYLQLVESRARLKAIADDGDEHICTRLLVIRIHRALGEIETARQIVELVLETIEGGQLPRLERPFLPALESFDQCRLKKTQDEVSNWLRALALDTAAELNTASRLAHPAQHLSRLAQRRVLPCAGIENERRLALTALRLGKKVTIKPGGQLMTVGYNSLIWGGIGTMLDAPVTATPREVKPNAIVYLQIGSIQEPQKNSISQAIFDFERYEGTPKLISIIASTPRCGSSYLGQVLQEHGFGVPHEYLNTVHIPYLAQRWGLISREKKIDLARYLETCLSWRTNTQGIFSLKAHWSQFQPFLEKKIIIPYLQKARFIYIRRDDLLGQAISYEIASQTGKWGSFEFESRKPVYDAEAIERRMVNIAQQNMAWTLFFAKNRFEKVDVVYEDFIKEKNNYIIEIINKIVPGFKRDLHESKPKPSELRMQRSVVNDDWREKFLAATGRDVNSL